MSIEGFEAAILAKERPRTHGFNRPALGTDILIFLNKYVKNEKVYVVPAIMKPVLNT
jgi:hypothetical protein